jgi:hypothetical protein
MDRISARHVRSPAALDGSSTTLAAPRTAQFGTHPSVTLPLASQSVALVRIGCPEQ